MQAAAVGRSPSEVCLARSAEVRAEGCPAQSVAMKLKWQDPAYRQRMSEAHRGKKQSAETKAKKARAMRGYWRGAARA